MSVRDTQRGTESERRTANWRSPELLASQATRTLGKPDRLARLGCSLCNESFVLDMEGHWKTRPEEMEILGREFLGVRADDVLCPRCLHDVELTGAQRIYWRLVHC